MTGYRISIGYNGGTRSDTEEMWEILKYTSRRIADDPTAIIAEARRCGSPENCERGCCPLDTYANNYVKPFGSEGHPIRIIDNGEEDRSIKQEASTDSPIKYFVRRAYILLVIQKMHRQGIDVNLSVC